MKLQGYLAAVVALAGTSQALHCYLCSNEMSSSGCDEYDFEPSEAYSQDDTTVRGTEYEGMYNCSVCAMYVAYNQTSGTAVSRSCAVVIDGPCVPESSVEGKIKCCYTDYCNSFTGDPSPSTTTTPHNPNSYQTTASSNPNSYQTTMPRGNNNSQGSYSGSPSMFLGVTSIAASVIMSLSGDPSSSTTTTPHNPNSYQTMASSNPYGYQTTMPRGNNNTLGSYSGSPSMFLGVTSIAVPVIMTLFLMLITSFT